MPRKATAEAYDPDHVLSKAEACKILQVAPAADEELITKAYWHLARKYRAYAPSDPEARTRLDQLNKAYVVLNPGKGEAPLAREIQPPPVEPPGFFEQAYKSIGQFIEHTIARWPEHVAEVSILTGTTAILTYLALSAGASALWTLLMAGLAGLVIWAPWRRPT
jgi:DnaJ domain